jgi:hypothetical protein
MNKTQELASGSTNPIAAQVGEKRRHVPWRTDIFLHMWTSCHARISLPIKGLCASSEFPPPIGVLRLSLFTL